VVRNCSDDATGFIPLIISEPLVISELESLTAWKPFFNGRLRKVAWTLSRRGSPFCRSQKDASRLRSTGSTAQPMSYGDCECLMDVKGTQSSYNFLTKAS